MTEDERNKMQEKLEKGGFEILIKLCTKDQFKKFNSNKDKLENLYDIYNSMDSTFSINCSPKVKEFYKEVDKYLKTQGALYKIDKIKDLNIKHFHGNSIYIIKNIIRSVLQIANNDDTQDSVFETITACDESVWRIGEKALEYYRDKIDKDPLSNYDSAINTYNKIIDEIELCLKTGDDCSNNFKLLLTVKALRNIDNIIEQEMSFELKEKFTTNIANNIIEQNMGFEKIKELTECIIDQIKVQHSKMKEWSKKVKSNYSSEISCMTYPLGTIVFYTGWCLLNIKKIDILTYFTNTIEKISDLRTLSCYSDTYDFIVKYQGWIMDLIITPFLGSLYALTLSQREMIKIEKENTGDGKTEQ